MPEPYHGGESDNCDNCGAHVGNIHSGPGSNGTVHCKDCIIEGRV